MFRFLSKFHLATRVYGGFLLVGAYVVFLCFFAMTAVGTVQKEYTKANAVMNATRQLTALETDFYALDQALFFFSKQRSAAEKKKRTPLSAAFSTKRGKSKWCWADPIWTTAIKKSFPKSPRATVRRKAI